MLTSTEDARSNRADRRLASTLAAVAGALNTAAFESVGFFSANMTGNVSSLSANLATLNLVPGIFFLWIVATFISGAVFSTIIINAGRRKNIRSVYALNILIEGGALMLLGIVECWLTPSSPGVVLILSLSFLMGLQNAVVTRISNARVRTTHVSGTSTDIGIELAMLFDVVRRKESPKEAPLYLERLRLHSFTLISFLLGGVGGVWIFNALGYRFLILIGFGLIYLAMHATLRKHSDENINI
ncbi:YoaK family protein [Rouxiella sp. WC2420]|uniref:YoaK family protein n=1 Tax=Rouxiella sp. WC2420 TaxID=3234145 RepID=A0AB39VMG4_9GAMM